MKVKGYWPSASTDEPQVLALAELLSDARVAQESDALLAVTALAKTAAGKRNDFRPTPAILCDMAVSVMRERLQRSRSKVPTGVNPDGTWYDPETGRLAEELDPLTGEVKVKRIAGNQTRDAVMADIAAEVPERVGAQEDLGGTSSLPHLDKLTTEQRKIGQADTPDEMVQYRWCFEAPSSWRIQPVCGPWVNLQSQALLAGKEWLANASRRYR